MFYSLHDVEKFLNDRKKHGIKPGLDRMKIMLEKLQNPERCLHAIHVAGTNGKGSTIQFLKNALIASNYRVGLFTSPSFSGICGHFFINNQKINDVDVLKLFNRLLPHINELDKKGQYLTEFEIITIMAILYLKDRVDVMIMETGMGGRYDATNCIIPIVSLITNVSIDHMQYLGKTLEEIAYHKAGIIKQKRPVIVGKLSKESKQVIIHEVKIKQSKMYQLHTDFSYKLDHEIVTWKGPKDVRFSFMLKMKGKHQIDNASLAIMALYLIEKKQICKINWELVLKSIASTTLLGRFEKVYDKPTIVIDSAHNVAGIKALIQTVKTEFHEQEKYILFAGFKDKELSNMVALLQNEFNEVVLSTFNHERAATLEELNQLIGRHDSFRTVSNWKMEITNIIEKLRDDRRIFFITGSLYFVSLVRHFILEQK